MEFQSNHYNPLQRGEGVSQKSQKIITLMVGGLLPVDETFCQNGNFNIRFLSRHITYWDDDTIDVPQVFVRVLKQFLHVTKMRQSSFVVLKCIWYYVHQSYYQFSVEFESNLFNINFKIK